VVEDPSVSVVDVEAPPAVVATVVTVEPDVVGTVWPSPPTALTITPVRKTSEKNPMRRPARLSMEGPRGIGAGV
jgi:hypothetical protein